MNMCWKLEEIIKYSEEVAEEKEKDARFYTFSRPDEYRRESSENCTANHRQLAEWLKDYKRLLERESSRDQQNDVIKKIRERVELEKLGYPPSAEYYRAIMKVLDIIDEYESEEQNE